MAKRKIFFGTPNCKGCECPFYVDDYDRGEAPMRAKGRRLQPGERYCLHGKRAVRFLHSQSRQRVPPWCPRKYRHPRVNIFTRMPRISIPYEELGMERPPVFPFPEDYVFVRQATVMYTPRQLYLVLRGNKEDLGSLFGWYPLQHDVLEIDTGLSCFYLFRSDKGWVQTYHFDTARCDAGRFGALWVQPFQGYDEGRYSLTSREYADECIGYTRGYFGGGKFHHHWTIRQEVSNDALYKEHEQLILTLEQESFLKSFEDLSDYCRLHFWARFRKLESSGDYGFYVNMKHYSFYLRCMPTEESSYHIYIFAYPNHEGE